MQHTGGDNPFSIRLNKYVADLLHLGIASLAQSHAMHVLGSAPTIGAMSRTTETFSVSLPPQMAVELEEVRREEHRTRSEMVREALRRYFKAKADKEKLVRVLESS